MASEVILVVEPDRRAREKLAQALSGEGREVLQAGDASAALNMVDRLAPSVVVSGVDLPGMGGLELLQIIRNRADGVLVILRARQPDLDLFARARELGAYDVAESANLGAVQRMVAEALALRRVRREGRPPAPVDRWTSSTPRLVGHDKRMLEVYRQIADCTRSDIAVLVTGESGTGKELIARAIHEGSQRSDGPFVPMRLGSLTPSLAGSALFGHVKGAFTDAKVDRRGCFEIANGGIVFLDEIGELPPELQPKLLGVLQEREFAPLGSEVVRKTDARVIAATNRDLRALVGQGTFRRDLYHRLAVMVIGVPPLRERMDDLSELVEHLLRTFPSTKPSDSTSGRLSVTAEGTSPRRREFSTFPEVHCERRFESWA